MFDTTAHPNANAVIIGATGSGKTFTAQLFALRLSLMNVQTFVIAPLKGREDYMGGCNAVGGQFVSMDPSAYNNINIMDIRVPDDEDLMRMEGIRIGEHCSQRRSTPSKHSLALLSAT